MAVLDWVRGLFARNRRAFDRMPVEARVLIRADGEEHVRSLTDVSPKGAFLSPELRLPVGTPGIMELPQVGLTADFRIVRHANGGTGVEFVQDNVGAIVAGWTKGLSPASS